MRRLPDWLRGYLVALACLLCMVAVSAILLRVIGPKATAFCALLLIILIARAAWIGYGPGLLVCFLTIFVVQYLPVPHRARPIDPVRLAFLVIIVLLISRISQNKARTERSLRLAADGLEQRVAERTLELSQKEEHLREQGQLLDLVPIAIIASDPNSVIRVWSKGAERVYGWTAAEATGKVCHELLQAVSSAPVSSILAHILEAGLWEGEARHIRRDGAKISVMSRWAPHRNSAGEIIGSLQVNTDITERLRIEEQLRQGQKMESVGRLAGGVAHDFNNLLTVINGYAELMMSDLPDDSRLREGLTEIRSAGDRAAGLTAQLLAFGRKQVLQPVVLNINKVIADTQKMLRRLIGEDIELVTRLDQSLANATADAGQIQQIIVNLAVNARDAMPKGGTLLFETANLTFDESFQAEHPEVQIGRVVLLAVTDTGTGMTPEVKDHLFEPFFTTKPKGAGTGLGLATVYGLVKQAGGWIWVYSEPGQGSAFKIYLPATDAPVADPKVSQKPALRGHETILVVEDQPEVSRLAEAALRRYGYTVLTASNGREALSLCHSFSGAIELVLTDVVMPGITGRDLANQIVAGRPEMRVLFMSGYTESAISHRGVLDAGVFYLQKPFTPETLAVKVREALGSNGNLRSTNG